MFSWFSCLVHNRIYCMLFLRGCCCAPGPLFCIIILPQFSLVPSMWLTWYLCIANWDLPVGSQTCDVSRQEIKARGWAVCSDNEGRTRWTSVTVRLVTRGWIIVHTPSLFGMYMHTQIPSHTCTAAPCHIWQQSTYVVPQVCDMFNYGLIMNIISEAQK